MHRQYGNLWTPSNSLPAPAVGPGAPTANVYNAANNRNANSTYDAAGNLTVFGSVAVSYDAENRQTAAGVNSYLYDGVGQRVEKVLPSGATVYAYDAFGQVVAEYTTAPAKVLCTTCYLSYDYLGSVRMVTDSHANVVARHDFAPFGQEIPLGVGIRTASPWSASDNVGPKFTGQMRDTETGEDFFNARYLSSGLGRFMSVDPYNAGADITNPQSWNGYAYVLGNPLNSVDPSGMSMVQCTDPKSIACVGNDPDFATTSNPYILNNALYAFWFNTLQFLSSGGSVGGGGTGGGGPSVTLTLQKTQAPPTNSRPPAPKALSCQINSRAANIPGGRILHSMGVNHEWITTSTGISVGMGTAQGVPQSDYPGVQTQVVNHAGQVPSSSATFSNIDPAALNTYIKAGTPTGPWIPGVNDCNTWANSAINNSTPHNVTIGIYGVPVGVGTNVVVYADGSIHAPGGN